MSLDALFALGQVILVDLVLAADNAIVVGMAAAGLAPELRRKAIIVGIAAAAILRVIFALLTVTLLKIPGILLIGGLLLLWVCWKLFGELKEMAVQLPDETTSTEKTKNFRAALTQIVIADVSMSLDNVLAVAGIARDHVSIMVFGLVLAVALMGVAASFVARLLQTHRWIAWVGLLVILYVAATMIWDGIIQVQSLI